MSNATVVSCKSVDIIKNSEKLGLNIPIGVFPNKTVINDNSTFFIFDLANDGHSLPPNLLNINGNNHNKGNYPFQTFHLDKINLLNNIQDLNFQNIIAITTSNKKDNNDTINNLFNNLKKISKYVFYDGISTLNNCQSSTFWIILKFFQYMKDTLHCNTTSLQIMLYESNQNHIQNAGFNSNLIFPSTDKPTKKIYKKRHFNLSLQLPVNTKNCTDSFIDSLKEDSIQYSPSSLLKYFHIKSLDSLYDGTDKLTLANKLNRFPIWLKNIVNKNDEKFILSSLWTKFNILEHLENMRLKSCLINSIENSSENNHIPNSKLIQFKDQYKNIYSLSLLQKQYKMQKNFEHKFNKLSVTIPPSQNSLNTNFSNNNSDITSLSICPTDSDILPTPLNNYKIDKGIQQFDKNRYSNNLPYEHSRVKLKNQNDYFNANFIKFPQINNNFYYIATQAPLPNTINDFWAMVWNEKTKVIISLNSNEELKLKKWDIYWDENLNINTRLNVQLVNQWNHLCGVDGITLRQFHLTRSDPLNKLTEEHMVYQLQYTNWLDSCVIDIDEILSIYKIRTLLTYNDSNFLSHLKSYEKTPFHIPPLIISDTDLKKNRHIPLLVHCSAGCGRTGVYIALDYLLCIFRNEIKDKNKINIWDMEEDLIFIIINELRKQRLSMVQTLTQYIACYDEIIRYFLSYR